MKHESYQLLAQFPMPIDVGFVALEAREDFDRVDPWFFLHQSAEAAFCLTDLQHMNVDTLEYCGIHRGRHVWLARR